MERNRYDTLVRHQINFEKVNGIQIIQPPIEQRQDSCSFAAVAKQLDYQLRILYANAEIPTPLTLPKNGCLIDYEKWQDELIKLNSPRRFGPEELLRDAKFRGIPLWNGTRFMIQDTASHYSSRNSFINVSLIKYLLPFTPIVGVILVTKDFLNDGKDVYEGKMEPVEDGYVKSDGERQEYATHAVVFLDICDIKKVTYIAYQNSYADGGRSMCPMSISWLRADQVVREVHYGACHPPVHPAPPMQSRQQEFNHSYELLQMNELIKSAKKIYQEAEELVLYSSKQNTTEAQKASDMALKNIGKTKNIFLDLWQLLKIYENVSAAVQIQTSNTEKQVTYAHNSGMEIELCCKELERKIQSSRLVNY